MLKQLQNYIYTKCIYTQTQSGFEKRSYSLMIKIVNIKEDQSISLQPQNT